jgi:prepilin-type N-terminal cleavage/methylation domain-containing protein
MRKRPAFTLVELVVAVAVSTVLITATTAIYSLFRRSISLDQARADSSQNGRIALDRLTRELRQAPDIVTPLPLSPADTSVAQPSEIQFEDGHANDRSYRRYYLENGHLRVQTLEYYFAYQPSVRVRWNEIGNGGVTPLQTVVSTQDVADSVLSFQLYGRSVITIYLTTGDGGIISLPLRTVVQARNL